MGKASSSKKVARAAGISGGRTRRGRRSWGYSGVIALIAILGVVGAWSSRDARLRHISAQGNSDPAVGADWNEGYAVYLCGKFTAPITHAKNPHGITTGDGDGIIHIQPKTKSAAGKNATLGKFADAVGMKLNAGEVQVPGGKLYQDGDKCSGKAGHVYVKQFNYIGDTVGQLYDGDTKNHQLPRTDPRNILLKDGDLLTIAFVPDSDKAAIPPPPATVTSNLQKLAGTSTSTTVPATGSSTTGPSTTGPSTTGPSTTGPSTTTTVKK